MKRLSLLIFLVHPLICFAELNNITSHPNWKLLNSETCGITYAERIVGGTDAPIGAYPWLARIGYAPKKNRLRPAIYRCGGAIINKNYIITAAHCVTNLEDKEYDVTRVRLGEHNTKTNPDCDDSFCNDPYKEYFIDEVIPHEKYGQIIKFKNDIALLRVKGEIKFSNFIRPICMPKGKLLQKIFVDQTGEVAGWGTINSHTGAISNLLQMLKLPIRSTSICQKVKNYRKYSIDSRQICAGGIHGKDTCGGDSGGPLMKVLVDEETTFPRYFIIGLVSFGLKFCGDDGTPGVYTDLSKYMPWALDHLRA